MSKINKLMFREYDIRGRIDDGLTHNAAELIGKAYGTFLFSHQIKKSVVGYDAREYSEGIKNDFVKGLISTGVDVVEIGQVISPILYFAQYHYKFKGGAMITASHNPNGWSGFKLGYDYATTLLPADIKRLYEIILKDNFKKGKGKLSKRKGVIKAYSDLLISKINLKRPLKIVVDAGNGTAGPIVPNILRKAGCQVEELYCDIDFKFPNHEPNPAAISSLKDLSVKIQETKADLGIAFDGDGDRLGTMDEKGNLIWPDQVIMLLARLILKDRPGAKIVFDVKCSQALIEDIKAHGGVPIMWKTGHSYIKQKSKEVNAALGGERSGHIFYRTDYYSYDDAVFAALKLIEYLSTQKKTFSQIIKKAPQYVSSPTYYVACADDIKYDISEKLTQEFKKEYGKDKVIDINGARVIFSDGWGLVRPSSNMPVLVMGFEAETKKGMERIMEIFKKKLLKYKEIGKKWQQG